MADEKIDLSLQEILARQGTNGKGIEDPTANVKDLVREVVIRIDALREAESRRSDDLRQAERDRIDAIMELRATYAEKLEIAEAKRIDAIRLVDTNAVAIANQRATEQAAVLASQVAASAETLRILVQQTAAAAKTQLDQTTQQLSDRISTLERFQYEGKNLSGIVPASVAEQLAQLQESRYRTEGRSGLSAPLLATIVAAAVGFAVFILQRLMMGG